MNSKVFTISNLGACRYSLFSLFSLKLSSYNKKPTCVQVEQLTLSALLKTIMLYFLLVPL